MTRGLWVGLLLFALTFAVHARAIGGGFIGWDDDRYVTQNPVVQRGLTLDGVEWALTSEHGGNWHPLTSLSHMLDCTLFGLRPAGHHATSVLLHALNAALVFQILFAATRALGPSALAAALFGLHPLRVESVAWIAERKDVLSALFGLLATSAWVAWTQRGGAWRYAAALVAFALALMAKPMLVTLPCAWLLLDVWPLERSGRRIWLEKLPFLALSAAASLATLAFQRSAGALPTLAELPLAARAANAVVSYARYLAKIAWPSDLAVLYPHPNLAGGTPWTAAQVAAAAVVVAALTALALRSRRGCLVVGWLWFLGLLVPVIGLVQVGSQAMADRYTYLPSIGIVIAVAFGLGELVGAHARRAWVRPAAGALAALVLGACAAATWMQIGLWRDTIALLEHSLAVAPDPPVLENNLGNAYLAQARLGDAERCFRAALATAPRSAEAHFNLALALRAQASTAEAVPHFARAIDLGYGGAQAHGELALALSAIGRSAEAVPHFRAALAQRPDWLAARSNLAWILATHPDPEVRRPQEAVELALRAAELTARDHPAVLDTLAAAYASAGRFDEAVATAEAAEALARAKGEAELARSIALRAELYRQGKPYVLRAPSSR